MKSGAAASYQGSAAATSTKTPDTAVQPEASTQAGLSQTADKKPAVQNFFTEKDQEDKDPSQEKDAKQGTQLKKAVNDLNKQMKNSEAIFGIHDKTNRVTIKIIDKTIGLRVPAEVEIDGLDIHEHGLASAYAGFSISDANAAAMVPNENTDLGEDDVNKASARMVDAAVPVVREAAPVIHDGVYDTGMHKVSIIAKLSKFDPLKTALNDLGVTGMTVTQVMGCGIQKGTSEKYRGVPVDSTLLPKIKVEVIVSKISVDSVVEAAKKALYTGHIGDGKIFVYNVTRVVKIRTGEEDFAALQDVE